MDTVTISRTYQVAIPRTVREQLKLLPGQEFRVMAYGDRIELLPVRTARDLKGCLRLPDAKFEREELDRP